MPENLAERVRQVREELGLSQKDIAGLLGISLRSWQGMEAGRNIPSGETLLKFGQINFNPGWILTGIAPQKLDETTNFADPELLERLSDRVSAVFRELGQKPPWRRVTRESANLYNELAKLVPDLNDAEMVEAQLRPLELQLKRRLQQAADQPGAGKRSVS